MIKQRKTAKKTKTIKKVKEPSEDYGVFLPSKTRYQAYDFKDQRAGLGRNAIHDYPAMLHTLLVDSLLKEFGHDKNFVYDPFCGSGTTAIQSVLHNKTVFGTDINPLSLLIAKVRSLNFNEKKYLRTLDELKYIISISEAEIPKIKNIEYWFKEDVILDLGRIRRSIRSINDDNIRNFFLVCFSKTVRTVSNSRSGEFKRFRIAEKKLKDFRPNTIKIFLDICNKYSTLLFDNKVSDSLCHLYLADVRKQLTFKEKIDLVITSPPYGDSRTTVAYGEFSSFSLEWIHGLNPFGDTEIPVDKLSLGGIINKYQTINHSKTLNYILEKIASIDIKRAKDVQSFYHDLFLGCENIVERLNKNAILIFIVGNRNVKGIQIPMDIIITEFFEYLGLKHIDTRIRFITSKRMPSLNSPTNIVGIKSQTMNEEFVVIFEK